MYEIKNAIKYPKRPVKRWFKESDAKKSLCILFIKRLEMTTKDKGIKRSGDNK